MNIERLFMNFATGLMVLGIVLSVLFLGSLAYAAPFVFASIVGGAVLIWFVGKLINDRYNILD